MPTSSIFRDLWLLVSVYRGGPIAQNEGPDPRVAVIMGAQVLRGGRPSRALEARVRHAARLYAGGELETLIPTGGLGEYPPKEADLMSGMLSAEGVPHEAILPEGAALNTWDSASLVTRIARKNRIERVSIVTDPLHCVRTVRAFEMMGLRAQAAPAYDSPMWRKLGSRTGQLIREAVALVWYRARYVASFRPRR